MGKNISTVLLILVASLVVACGSGQEGGSTMSQAKSYLEEGDYRSAMLTLKNIIKSKPDDKAARLFLGKVYLPIGDGASAEKELKKAKQLGAKKSEYLVLLAKALLLQGKSDQVISLAQPLDNEEAKINAEILSVRGDAYLASNDIQKAEASYLQALKYDSASILALRGVIKVSMAQNNADKVQKTMAVLIRIAPNDATTWSMNGFIQSRNQQHAESEASFQKAIDLLHEKQMSRAGFSARSGLVQEQLKQGKFDQALDNVNALLKAQPNHPSPKYMRALIAFERKNYKLVEEYLSSVVTAAPNYLPGRLLMGTVQYALGNYEQARDNLQKVINEVPSHIQARKMLASVYLKLRDPEDAFEVLSAAEDEDSDDGQLLAMMGKAALSSGDLRQGLELYKKAVSASPNEPSIRAELASLYLKKGAYKNAIKELEEIDGVGENQAKKMIIYAHIRDQAYDQALVKVKKLAADAPGDASIPAIFGAIELSRGERGKAREYFRKSLSMDSNFEPALSSLARMDFEEGSLDGAEAWYDKVLQQKSSSLIALLGMAQISEKRGKSDQALAWVEKAAVTNPNALAPIIILANYHLKVREYQKAENVIAQAEKTMPGNLELARLKAKSLYAQGKTDEVIEILERLIRAQPRNVSHYLQIASVLDRANRLMEARTLLIKAKEKVSATPALINALVRVEAKLGNFEDALKYIKAQKKDQKSAALWYALEGDVYLQQKKYPAAEKAYKNASKVNDSHAFASKLALTRYATGDVSGAIAVVNDWIKRHPKDFRGMLPLAQLYIRFGKYKEAVPLFEKISNQVPKNALVLNNLAWLYSQTGDSRALPTAERAHQLAPTSGAVSDTYGWLLVGAGEFDRGIELLREASELSDGNLEIQLHLASALVQKGGSQEEAKLLVESLVSSGKLKTHAELKKLQEKLRLM